MKVESSTIPGACGMGVLYDFYEGRYGVELETLTPCGGAGYVMAGFIEGDKVCNEAFKIMEKRWGPPVWKSEVRLNRNSDNQFYTAVFDCSEGGEGRYGFDHADEDRS